MSDANCQVIEKRISAAVKLPRRPVAVDRQRKCHAQRVCRRPAPASSRCGNRAACLCVRRLHVENPHFGGVLAANRKKYAFFQRFSRLFACVLKKPWL
jgi:hypothetical protein